MGERQPLTAENDKENAKDPGENKGFLSSKKDKILGYLLIFCASATSAGFSVVTKQLSNVEPLYMMWIRNLVVSIAIAGYMVVEKISPFPEGTRERVIIFVRGFSFFYYATALTYAFRYTCSLLTLTRTLLFFFPSSGTCP